MALDDYAGLIQAGQNLVPDINRQLAETANLSAQAQEMRANAAATTYKAQRTLQFQRAFAASDGSPKSVAHLMMQFPEAAQELKAGLDAQDKAQRDADFRTSAEIYSAASSGNWALAGQLAHTRADAEKAAGNNTPGYDAAMQAMDEAVAGNPDQRKSVLTFLGSHLAAAAGPEQFATVYGALNKDKGYTLGQGETRFNEDNQQVASVAAKPDFLVVPEGGKAIPLNPAATAVGTGGTPATGGGGPASPGAAPPVAPGSVVSRTHGYTPRLRDGGDNPDNVVDNKIAALSKAVGVNPDTPMTPQQFAAFVQALPGTENSPGNNPGGIKDGAFAKAQPGYAGARGQYAVFTDPQSGSAAMQKLLTSRFYNRGQLSIRDIIEGHPVANGQAQAHPNAAPYYPAQPGDVPGTVYGNPKPQARILNPDEAKARGLDTAKVYELRPDGSVSAVGDADTLNSLPGNPNLSGPAYLASIPPNLATQVKALAEGRLPMPSSFALAKPYWQKLLQMTAQYDPTFDAANAPARKAAITAFTGMGKAAQVVGSVNRVANHLNTLWNESKKLAGPETGWSVTNSLLATAGQSFEPADAKAYDTAVGFVAGELEKIARNSPGTEAGVERVVKNLGRKNSAQTREAAIKTAVDIIAGAIDPLKDQYNSAFTNDSTRPRIPWVSPQAQKVYQRIGGTNGGVDLSLTGAGADTNSPSNVVQVRSVQQYNSLPSGAHYLDPNGVPRVKR